jgi:hypothetical protein
MTALLVVETAVLAVLCVLVAGLLRAYAGVLQRLHALDGGDIGGSGVAGQPAGAPPFRTVPEIAQPPASARVQGRQEWQPAHDIEGISLHGEIVSARTVGVPHDTVLAFLSSGCDGCAGFWHELGRPAELQAELPPGTRLLVVSKDAAAESPSALDQLCPAGVDVVMSGDAWADYAVPGSPYIVVVDGQTGRVKGEGSGTSFSQIGGLIRQAADDASRLHKPAADRERESDVDRVLLGAGISPGDPSLYAVADPAERPLNR